MSGLILGKDCAASRSPIHHKRLRMAGQRRPALLEKLRKSVPGLMRVWNGKYRCAAGVEAKVQP